MFSRWGDLVHRSRFTVIGVMVAFLLGLAAYGLSLNDHLSQSGWDDPNSESVHAAVTADGTFGRDSTGDVVALYTAPEGSTVDDPAFQQTVTAGQDAMMAAHSDKISKININYFQQRLPALASPDKTKAIATFAIAGANDTELTNNFRDVKDAFAIDGVDVQLAGLQPIANALNDTMAGDIKRMEILAIPVVGVLLFFVFGGVVAAALPLIIGGLTVVAANGMVRLFTNFVEVNSFVAPVVSLIGLGLAIDYALFIVSRFREELADGRTTQQAVQRSVMTAGRTVVFSATMIVASLGGLLLFPQGFLKSVAFGAIATVALAALTAITILPAILSILGPRIDALGLKSMRKTKTTEEIESGPWGKLTRWVMRNPLKVCVPIVLGLLILTLPVGAIKFGGINETYLPPDNPTRVAQNVFDENFPSYRTEPLKIVLENAEGPQLGTVLREASNAPGLVERFSIERNENGVAVLKAGLVDRNVSSPAIDYIRSIDVPDGVTLSVGGTPAIEQDSIAALVDRLPLMATLVVLVTTLLMFLTFGSLVLPLKAILMTTLGLGATLGILTFIFVDGNGAGLLNFTPGPIMAPVLVLIIAIIFGLSTDYEVFLLSRMVEARARGASTTEAIRVGTSHTGRIITAAALILIVVTGAFAFSELVMMKYIAYGMIAALIIDATLIRMFLVPATMKLLGDDCWWAPQWMKRIQQKLGLGEPILDAEMMPTDVPELVAIGSAPLPARTREPLTQPIPRVMQSGPSAARAMPERVAPDRPRPVAPRPAPERVQKPAVQEPPVQQPAAPEPVAPRAVEPTASPVAPAPAPAEEIRVARPAETRPARASDDQQSRPTAGPEPTSAEPAPRNGAPAPRPIESWLAELRAPSVAQRSNGSNGSNGHETTSFRYGSVSGDGIDVDRPRNGDSNGNGHSNGNGNGNGNGHSNGNGGPHGNGSRTSAEVDSWIAGLRMPEREDRPAPEPETHNPSTPEVPEPDETPPTTTSGRRRARDGDDESGGRHHGQSGAISVSELLARQRRQ
ncbi:MMPL family transporter [Rhodococcus sp. NBC_00297]|uniref:MMPL family transporter n=1 Tax=Rhodococcus sp. NBC_00297 TaxID=2976005 RepID=UPI002E2BF4EE|nr:MMPL family transporter [Rhodococcus sp. NBC_00297]